jgi:hypothetical protein
VACAIIPLQSSRGARDGNQRNVPIPALEGMERLFPSSLIPGERSRYPWTLFSRRLQHNYARNLRPEWLGDGALSAHDRLRTALFSCGRNCDGKLKLPGGYDWTPAAILLFLDPSRMESNPSLNPIRADLLSLLAMGRSVCVRCFLYHRVLRDLYINRTCDRLDTALFTR